MPSHKVLKSIVRSVADSFTSLMNYEGDDYVMGHLLTAARRSGKTVLWVSLLTGAAEPKELLVKPVARSVRSYVKSFSDLVVRSGSSTSFILAADLKVSFDTAVTRMTPGSSRFAESPYTCEVTILDDRRKLYSARLSGWWYPEQVCKPSLLTRLRRLLGWLT